MENPHKTKYLKGEHQRTKPSNHDAKRERVEENDTTPKLSLHLITYILKEMVAILIFRKLYLPLRL